MWWDRARYWSLTIYHFNEVRLELGEMFTVAMLDIFAIFSAKVVVDSLSWSLLIIASATINISRTIQSLLACVPLPKMILHVFCLAFQAFSLASQASAHICSPSSKVFLPSCKAISQANLACCRAMSASLWAIHIRLKSLSMIHHKANILSFLFRESTGINAYTVSFHSYRGCKQV